MVISNIVDIFHNLSKEHKLIRSFRYATLSKSEGIGEEKYPQCFLEDPIVIDDSTLSDGTLTCEVNFNITMTPQAFQNYNRKQLSVIDCQNIAHEIALSFIARIRNLYLNYDEYENKDYHDIKPVRWNFITLRNWYDNDAAGVRCTLILSIPNPIEYCNTEEHFDEEKEFDIDNKLSNINTDNADGCTTFDFKLSKFTL